MSQENSFIGFELQSPNFDNFEEKMEKSQDQIDLINNQLESVMEISSEFWNFRFTI